MPSLKYRSFRWVDDEIDASIDRLLSQYLAELSPLRQDVLIDVGFSSTQISSIQRERSDNIFNRMAQVADVALVSCREIQSPMERLLFVALLLEMDSTEDERVVDYPPVGGRSEIKATGGLFSRRGGDIEIAIERKIQIGSAYVDFCFTVNSQFSSLNVLTVECDGHEWHNSDKAIIGRDRARDRELLDLGITAYRFTGSQIFRDPRGCAQEILRWCDLAMTRPSRDQAVIWCDALQRVDVLCMRHGSDGGGTVDQIRDIVGKLTGSLGLLPKKAKACRPEEQTAKPLGEIIEEMLRRSADQE